MSSWAPEVPSDVRHRALGLLNQEPATASIPLPLPNDRAVAFGLLYAGDQLKRIADLLEQSTSPLPPRRQEPGVKVARRALVLVDGRSAR